MKCPYCLGSGSIPEIKPEVTLSLICEDCGEKISYIKYAGQRLRALPAEIMNAHSQVHGFSEVESERVSGDHGGSGVFHFHGKTRNMVIKQ